MRLLCTMISILATLTLSAQQWCFWIDEKQPAERTALRNAQDVLLVNNCVIQPQDFGHNIVVDGNTTNQEQVNLDRGPLFCLFAATQTMEESLEFNRVELLQYTQNPTSNFYSRSALSAKQMQELCSRYAVDALLILNQLVLYNVIESFSLDDGTCYSYLQAYAQSHWTVYSHGKTHSFSVADTLMWESDPMYSRARTISQLPTTQEALYHLASSVGELAGGSLVSQWIPVPRYLYDVPNTQVSAGLQSFRYQRWNDAIAQWKIAVDAVVDASKAIKQGVSKADKKAAAYAAANIAIAYEMLGDYALASDYANEAYRLFGALKTAYGRQQQVNIRYYQAQLREKKAN